MSVVWIPHHVKDDVSPAEVYGRLEYVNHRYVYSDEIQGENLPLAFTRNMTDAVSHFDPRNDYLLLAGDYLQMAALSAMLQERHGSFRVLRFDRQAGGYVSIRLRGVPGLTTDAA